MAEKDQSNDKTDRESLIELFNSLK